MSLTEQQWQQLIECFDNEDAHELLPDFPNLHGLATAAALDAEQPGLDLLWKSICDPLPVEERPNDQIKALVGILLEELRAELHAECQPGLPFDNEDSSTEDSRISWCVGFIEWVSEREWDMEDEEAAANLMELLLPIQIGSTLFDDDPEFTELKQNKQLWQQMISEIPEVLTDLYFLLHGGEQA